MIRLILLVSLSISPIFVANAQNLTPQERNFLGDNSSKYLNAYRFPQRRIESGSSSSAEITNQYLSQKVKRGTVVVQSHTPSIEPAFELSELPQIEQIELPSAAPIGPPASILPKPNTISNKVGEIAETVTPTAPKEATKSELLQQEERLKSAVEEMRQKKQLARVAAPVVPKPAAVIPKIGKKTTEVMNDPIQVKAQAESIVTKPAIEAPVVKDNVSKSSEQVEELRALIQKLKQSRQ